MKKQTCRQCKYWCDATAECTIALREDYQGLSKEMQAALDKNSADCKNNCDQFAAN